MKIHDKGYIMLTHTLEVLQNYNKYFQRYTIQKYPQTYTGSENIGITNNEIPANFPLNVNDEIVLNPRVNCYFEIYSAPNCISFLQHNSDGTQPIAIFNSLDKSV